MTQPMKKTYFAPALKVEEAQTANMLAESLIISDNVTVDGDDALTKESAWDIWDNEE